MIEHRVLVHLDAVTRQDLDAAIVRIGLVRVSTGPAVGGWFADGALELYDTPESAEAKARWAGDVVRRFIRDLEQP